jgi:hypothetical protein
MKTIATFTMSLALCAVPSFAGKTYNASHSNTGNTTVQNPKGGNQKQSKAKTYNSSHSNTANTKAATSTSSRSNTQHN